MNFNLTYIYVLAFTALSGLGIVFLNPESILAFCFFLFFYLIIVNSDAISTSLNEQKQTLRSQLLTTMIHGQTATLNTRKVRTIKKIVLLDTLKQLVHNTCIY